MDGYSLVNLLGGLLIATSLAIVLSKAPRQAAIIYIVQSLVLVLMFIVLAVATDSHSLFLWSFSAFLTKVVLLPGVILFALRKMQLKAEALPASIPLLVTVILVAAELFLCFIAVQSIELPTAIEVKPALAISLAHFFIGLTCIITQRNLVKQVFGYCLMENGSHLTLALLAPDAPELIEVGIATDAIFAVIIMAVIVYRIYSSLNTVDANELKELRG